MDLHTTISIQLCISVHSLSAFPLSTTMRLLLTPTLKKVVYTVTALAASYGLYRLWQRRVAARSTTRKVRFNSAEELAEHLNEQVRLQMKRNVKDIIEAAQELEPLQDK